MDLLSKKYKQAEEISNLKAEIKRLKECNEELTSDNLNTIQEMDNERRRVEQFREENERLNNCLMESLTHEKNALDVSIKYKETLQEIKEIAKTGMHCEGMGCDFMPKILDLITKAEEE